MVTHSGSAPFWLSSFSSSFSSAFGCSTVLQWPLGLSAFFSPFPQDQGALLPGLAARDGCSS